MTFNMAAVLAAQFDKIGLSKITDYWAFPRYREKFSSFISVAYKDKGDSPDRVQTALHQAMSMDYNSSNM